MPDIKLSSQLNNGKPTLKVKRRILSSDNRKTRELCCDPENGRPCKCKVAGTRKRKMNKILLRTHKK